MQEYDVVICGGGIVGLGLALALAPNRLRLALLDPREIGVRAEFPSRESVFGKPGSGNSALTPISPPISPRVSALTPASRELLAALGVWEKLEALRVCPYTDMRVWDADGTGSIHFSAAELHQPCLGYIVENGLISAVLAEAARASGQVDIVQDSLDCFTTQSGLQHLTLASGRQMSCRLVIGADGGSSRVRKLAGITTREWDYGHRALVTTVKTAKAHAFTAWQRFMPSGPLAFLPLFLPDAAVQQYSSIVWSCVPELAEELLALDDTQFARRLETAFEHKLGAVESVAPRQAFALWQKHVGDYVRPGLALIGDAAHTIHPLAGQGVNLGLSDVKSLAGVLTRSVGRGEDFASEQVLSRYQRERKAANLGMMLLMEGFRRAFGSDDIHLRWLRNAGLRAADALSPFKHAVMKGAMGLK